MLDESTQKIKILTNHISDQRPCLLGYSKQSHRKTHPFYLFSIFSVHGKAWINSELENITSAFQFCSLMFLWLTLKRIAVLDFLVGIKMFEKRGKTKRLAIAGNKFRVRTKLRRVTNCFFRKTHLQKNVWPEQKQTFLHFN